MDSARRFSVYVGNIPFNTSEDELGNFFSTCGEVRSFRIVYDRATNRSKGFGFCEFGDEKGAESAIETLNGSEFNGRVLRVSWAIKS